MRDGEARDGPLVARQPDPAKAQCDLALAPAPSHLEKGLKAHRARKRAHNFFQGPFYPLLSLKDPQGAIVIKPNHELFLQATHKGEGLFIIKAPVVDEAQPAPG